MSHNNFIDNKYYKWYNSIIANRKTSIPDDYSEVHHIIPKSLGGNNSDDNLVRLTAREHLLCHRLLTRFVTGQAYFKMLAAVDAFKMCKPGTGRYLTSRMYEQIRKENKNLPNAMHRPEVKERHLEGIAQKLGYNTHSEYLNKVKTEFERCKTIKATATETGHAQYTIRHLLTNTFGKEWVDSIRKIGLCEARVKQSANRHLARKPNTKEELNPNAYVWEATSPAGKVITIKGKRIPFCKEQGIGTSLDPKKPHLRGFWEFTKLCKVKDYLP